MKDKLISIALFIIFFPFYWSFKWWDTARKDVRNFE